MYPGVNESLITKGLNTIKNINFSAFLDGTQKTLGVINQAIPIFYQVKPIISNAKTLFKISSIMNDNSNNTNNSSNTSSINNNTKNSPIFYI